jgi:copper transport protein
MRRRAAAVFSVAMVAFVLPAAAAAHATLAGATPEQQSSVDTPPGAVVLRFDQAVTAVDDAIEVFAGDGEIVSRGAVSAARGREIRGTLDELPLGAYTVRWRALSSDGHIVSGVFTFGVGVAAPPPTEAVGAVGLTLWDDIAKWASFAALSILVGPLVVLLVVLRGHDPGPRARRAFYLTAAVGAFAVLNVGIVSFVLRAENALQLSLVDLLYADLTPFSEKTRFGVAFMVSLVGFGAVAALAILAWTFGREALLWPALVGSLLLASGLSLSGHQATEPNSTWATQFADWLHLMAASVWVGGVLALAVIVWPLSHALRRVAFLGFSRIAVVLVAVLVLAGTYLSIVRLPDVSDLWTTSYGQLLLLKIGVVLLALAWGGMHHMLVRPRLERGEAPSGGVGRSLIGESAVAMGVLLVAAVLVNGSPPPVETGDSVAVTASEERR